MIAGVLFKDGSCRVVGAMFGAYREMGCGFLEPVYQVQMRGLFDRSSEWQLFVSFVFFVVNDSLRRSGGSRLIVFEPRKARMTRKKVNAPAVWFSCFLKWASTMADSESHDIGCVFIRRSPRRSSSDHHQPVGPLPPSRSARCRCWASQTQ